MPYATGLRQIINVCSVCASDKMQYAGNVPECVDAQLDYNKESRSYV